MPHSYDATSTDVSETRFDMHRDKTVSFKTGLWKFRIDHSWKVILAFLQHGTLALIDSTLQES